MPHSQEGPCVEKRCKPPNQSTEITMKPPCDSTTITVGVQTHTTNYDIVKIRQGTKIISTDIVKARYRAVVEPNLSAKTIRISVDKKKYE